LTSLVGLPEVTISANDLWWPAGKPVRTNNGWDATPAAEAQIDRDDCFVAMTVRRALVEWWLAVAGPTSRTPQWDVASTCSIEGRNGLVLVEAKAHSNELSTAGKSKPHSENGWKNHDRIGSAIAQANIGLQRAAGGSWALSRDRCYQLSNRFAWSWKLVSLGVPVILIYLGFLKAGEMAPDGELFWSENDWETTLRGHARGVCDDACWGMRVDVNGAPLRPLIRAIDSHSRRTCSGAHGETARNHLPPERLHGPQASASSSCEGIAVNSRCGGEPPRLRLPSSAAGRAAPQTDGARPIRPP